MKEYYVDKFPDSCFNCQFSTEACYCKLNSLMTDTVTFYENFYKHKRYKDCPLKLLSDHDKQVRKEMCEEIKEKAYDLFCDDTIGWLRREEMFLEYLDQIQG